MKNTHSYYIQRCLQLAKMGMPAAMPNPSVGAVLVCNDKIIGEGFTSAYGGSHAEVNCLASVKDKMLIPESVLYVSLEPCSHTGKTPPCANLIIEQGIKQVVVGCLDTNSEVAGKGIKHLRDNGIEVILGVEEEQCRENNKRFFTFHEKQRPYIILKWAQTKNGYFSKGDNSQFWITNNYSKQIVHQWRNQEQAILVGANTVLSDDPALSVREVGGSDPIRVVITDKKLSADLKVFNDGKTTIVYTNQPENGNNNELKCVVLEDNKILLMSVLQDLYKRKIQSLIVEGGAAVIQQFINENLWDETRILIGKSVLEDGLKAPRLTGELLQEFDLNGDNCLVYKNTVE